MKLRCSWLDGWGPGLLRGIGQIALKLLRVVEVTPVHHGGARSGRVPVQDVAARLIRSILITTVSQGTGPPIDCSECTQHQSD